jgi:conjugative relaxase-like TrwC/TraI family protein
MLTVTALTDAEYVLSSVALGIDEYYAGVGEAPGVWSGGWSHEFALEGMVEADELRALIDGTHPVSGQPLLVGLRERSVKAFDLTFSVPKSVSLLWALGSVPIADTVMAAHRDAVAVALGFLEEHAATARLQVDGVRRHVGTHGWAVAGFVHRTSREGDPQLHTHCLVPNIVRRQADGRCVALAARPLFVWARAAGSVYQAELQRSLGVRLGVEWGPDRSNTREIAGFTRGQLRAFSKRTVQIEAELEARGARYESPALRMRADDEASLATRPAKDHSLNPALLAGRWETEAAAVDLAVGPALDRVVCWRDPALPILSVDDIVRALVDEESGLCAHSPRFAEPDVIEYVAALSAGRLTLDEIRDVADRFLHSDQVVRLVPARSASGWEPARWSTTAHRALEDQTLALLDRLQLCPGSPVPTGTLAGMIELGADQRHAVEVLCGPGGSVRAVLAPAGHGKTAMVHAAAHAAWADGRPVIAVATTAKAVAELVDAGLPASTIARLRLELERGPLAAGTVVVLDEVSQTSTCDAHTVLEAVAACPGGQLWVLGDSRQAPSVKAGGIAAELDARVTAGAIPAATLTVNRRQVDPIDRHALGLLRAGSPVASQRLRTAQGWEHERATPAATRGAMAHAVVADIVDHGADATVALVTAHGQAEDLTDRIRHYLTGTGLVTGPAVIGPGWTSDRPYQAGDRILLHTRYGDRHSPLVNGTVSSVTAVHPGGLDIRTDAGVTTTIATEFVRGVRPDGTPNLSHAWARTVDGAQGGTWDHAHLLGTAALDAYRGYTGQSRSRHPTHTWNTTPIDDGDHGGRLADRRTAGQQVAGALARVPDTTLAAVDDPWPTNHRLQSVVATHQAVLDRRPPDRSRELDEARRAAAHARARLGDVEDSLAALSAELEATGVLAAVTRSGRARRHDLEHDLLTYQDAAVDAAGALASAAHRVERHECQQSACEAFERTEGWRAEAVAAARDQLEVHWTAVAVTCCRADQPLAYGVTPLRLAHHRLRRQLAELDASIPIDRDAERRLARAALADVTTRHRHVQCNLIEARNEHNELSSRRWPRRDSEAIGRAADRVETVCHRFDEAGLAVAGARANLDALDAHQRRRQHALVATAGERRNLTSDLAAVGDGLERTRTDRVLDIADRPTSTHLEVLGPVPTIPAARAVWCAAALRFETHLDAHGLGGPGWSGLSLEFSRTAELCAVAARYLHLDSAAVRPLEWAHIADHAREIHNQLTIDRHFALQQQIEHSIDLDIGL